MDYKEKYLKYKNKYLELKKIIGGVKIGDLIVNNVTDEYVGSIIKILNASKLVLETANKENIQINSADIGVLYKISVSPEARAAAIEANDARIAAREAAREAVLNKPEVVAARAAKVVAAEVALLEDVRAAIAILTAPEIEEIRQNYSFLTKEGIEELIRIKSGDRLQLIEKMKIKGVLFPPVSLSSPQIVPRKLGINKNLSLYRLDGTQLLGGHESDKVWPVISMRWIKNLDNLGLKSDDDTIKFKFCLNNDGNPKAPLLAKGGFSAVYEIDDFKGNIYIFKIFRNISDTHLFNIPKVKSEMIIFEKYFMDILYYGQFKTFGKDFIPKSDTYDEGAGEMNYTFDYYITKKYNTADSSNGNGSRLSNVEKYNLLKNSLVFLKDLQINNYFHSDFKIGNIGWINNMEIIMIDYDINTLLEATATTSVSFPTTYIPGYIPDLSTLFNRKRLIKYSIGGLGSLIDKLNLNIVASHLPIYIPGFIKILRRFYWIPPRIVSQDLTAPLNFYNMKYDLVPRYDELLVVFRWLYDAGHLAR